MLGQFDITYQKRRAIEDILIQDRRDQKLQKQI